MIDPTLTALVPRRSRARNAALAILGVAVIVGAWYSPAVLRPTLVGSSGGGSWTPVGGSEVVTAMIIGPTAWPFGTIVRVEDLPGAHVTGAWLVPSEPSTLTDLGDADGHTSGMDLVTSSLGGIDLTAAELPQRFTSATSGNLVILWQVDDCTALVEGQRPTAVMRSVVGSTTTIQLAEWDGPAFDLSMLADAGTCPAAE